MVGAALVNKEVACRNRSRTYVGASFDTVRNDLVRGSFEFTNPFYGNRAGALPLIWAPMARSK